MLVSEAIALLKLMPQDAVLVGHDGPMQSLQSKSSARFGAQVAEPVLNGFSAEEIRREKHELFLLEKSNIVVLAMTHNSEGNPV